MALKKCSSIVVAIVFGSLVMVITNHLGNWDAIVLAIVKTIFLLMIILAKIFAIGREIVVPIILAIVLANVLVLKS